MRTLALLLLLTLTACAEPIRGGSIVGKTVKGAEGIWGDQIRYYLQLKQGDKRGQIEVTKAAWDQAKESMTWPFEIKK